MANQEAFQAQGAIQLSLKGPSNPQLGKNYAVNGQAPIPLQGGMAGKPVLQQQPVGGGGGGGFSAPQAPKGAQPVALVGQPSPLGGQPQMPMSPPARPIQQNHALGQQQLAGSAPFLTKTPTQQGGGASEVHTISVIGLGSDGKRYVAEFDAVFPPGTTIKEVSERMGQ